MGGTGPACWWVVPPTVSPVRSERSARSHPAARARGAAAARGLLAPNRRYAGPPGAAHFGAVTSTLRSPGSSIGSPTSSSSSAVRASPRSDGFGTPPRLSDLASLDAARGRRCGVETMRPGRLRRQAPDRRVGQVPEGRGLVVRGCGAAGPGRRPRLLLLSITRSRIDGTSGFAGAFRRPIINRRSRSGVRGYLEHLKRQVERAPATSL